MLPGPPVLSPSQEPDESSDLQARPKDSQEPAEEAGQDDGRRSSWQDLAGISWQKSQVGKRLVIAPDEEKLHDKINKEESELEKLRQAHAKNRAVIRDKMEVIEAVRAGEGALSRYASAENMTERQLRANISVVEDRVRAIRKENAVLQLQMDNINSKRLARQVALDLSSKPLSADKRPQIEAKFKFQETKINMAHKMLLDLDAAEKAFPERGVDIAVRRYVLAQEMKKIHEKKERYSKQLNPTIQVIHRPLAVPKPDF